MSENQRITGGEIIQLRAVKTREKILEKALLLYADKGYYNTTVDEIAKSADLSVGTAYRYFKDKKELLLAALKYGFTHVTELTSVSVTDIFGPDLERALKIFEKIHMDFFNLHEELEGLRHTDEDVRQLYDEVQESALKEIHDNLPKDIKERPNSFQDLRIAIGLMENHCHYYMHENSNKKTIAYMRKKIIEMVEIILSGKSVSFSEGEILR